MLEAAKLLRISRRKLQALIKDHPHYYRNGNRKLFEDSDNIALRQAMRRETELELQRNEQCRSNLSRRAKTKARVSSKRRSTASGGPTSGSTWTEAQRR